MKLARLLPVLLVMTLLGACGGTGDPERASTTPSAESKAPATAPGTQAEAQDALDAATAKVIDKGSLRYDVVAALTLGGDSNQITVTGTAMMTASRTDQTMRIPTETGEALLRTVQIGGDAYSLLTVDGTPQPCWVHISRGKGPEARRYAITPPLLMLVDPNAHGRLEGGSDEEYVMDVLLDEATSAVFPKLANKLEGKIPAAASIPARAHLSAGEWNKVTYELADVLSGLQDAGVALTSDDLGGLDPSSSLSGTVTIEYSQFGQRYSISAPPARQVTDMTGVASEEDYVPCAAAG